MAAGNAARMTYNRITSDTREELFLFTKLFFIMGLSWFLECFHVELHGDHSTMRYCSFYTEVGRIEDIV